MGSLNKGSLTWLRLLLFSLFFFGSKNQWVYLQAAEKNENQSLVGKWLYYKYIYKNQEFFPPNPDLNMTFDFWPDGKDFLRWNHIGGDGQRGACEREGVYQWSEGKLTDRITWVNPDNALGCGADPDMQLGRESSTVAEIRNGDFWLHLSLGNEALIYVWKRLPTIE